MASRVCGRLAGRLPTPVAACGVEVDIPKYFANELDVLGRRVPLLLAGAFGAADVVVAPDLAADLQGLVIVKCAAGGTFLCSVH
jgi:hypothetical protein